MSGMSHRDSWQLGKNQLAGSADSKLERMSHLEKGDQSPAYASTVAPYRCTISSWVVRLEKEALGVGHKAGRPHCTITAQAFAATVSLVGCRGHGGAPQY